MELVVKKLKPFNTIDYLMFGPHRVNVIHSEYDRGSLRAEFDIDDDDNNELLETIMDYDITEAVLYDEELEPFTVPCEEVAEYFDTITFYAKGNYCEYAV